MKAITTADITLLADANSNGDCMLVTRADNDNVGGVDLNAINDVDPAGGILIGKGKHYWRIRRNVHA